jgi:hypothetical protein
MGGRQAPASRPWSSEPSWRSHRVHPPREPLLRWLPSLPPRDEVAELMVRQAAMGSPRVHNELRASRANPCNPFWAACVD